MRAASVKLIQASPSGYSSGPASSSTCCTRSSSPAFCCALRCSSLGVVLICCLLYVSNRRTHARCASCSPLQYRLDGTKRPNTYVDTLNCKMLISHLYYQLQIQKIVSKFNLQTEIHN